MTFIRDFQVRNRSEILREAYKIADSSDRDKKRFVLLMKIILMPIYISLKLVKLILLIPMYLCVMVGSVFEYLVEITDDINLLAQDFVFLLSRKVMLKDDEIKQEDIYKE